MILENEACKLTTDYNKFSNSAITTYKYLNAEIFEDFEAPSIFKPILTEIFKLHKQDPKITYVSVEKPTFTHNNKVLLCASGGLDSCYQALVLREQGYDVTLFHIANLNAYTNGQEKKCFLEFVNKFNFNYILLNFSATHKGSYRKFWSENSFKSIMTYIIAVDYMLALGIGNLSSGDDLGLDEEHQALGVNTGDTNTVTKAFINSFKVNFIPVDRQVNKLQRLNYLYQHGAGDCYNSCVTAGRLTKTLHDKYEAKFNIVLDKYCCCSCRKCCMHILQLHYFNNKAYSEELINHCWCKLATGADGVYFNKSIPLQVRIKNLLEY